MCVIFYIPGIDPIGYSVFGFLIQNTLMFWYLALRFAFLETCWVHRKYKMCILFNTDQLLFSSSLPINPLWTSWLFWAPFFWVYSWGSDFPGNSKCDVFLGGCWTRDFPLEGLLSDLREHFSKGYELHCLVPPRNKHITTPRYLWRLFSFSRLVRIWSTHYYIGGYQAWVLMFLPRVSPLETK